MSNSEVLFFNHYSNKSGPISEDQFLSNSGLASSRIQLRPCYFAAKRLHYNCQIYSLNTSTAAEFINSTAPKVCIVGKLNAESDDKVDEIAISYLAAVARLKRQGTHITLIYSDNHLYGLPKVKELYRDLIFFADTIICPTKTLKNYVLDTGFKEERIHIVEDPWSLKMHTYKRKIKTTLNIAWFGSGLNAPYLARELPAILTKTNISKTIKLSILTTHFALKALERYIKTINYDKNRFRIDFIKWDKNDQPNQLEQLLENSDFSIIPSDPNDPRKAGVSHNRIVDSSRSGCIPLASPMNSYLELKKIAILGTNFPAMIETCYPQRNRLARKYELNRTNTLSSFSPEINAEKWDKILASIFASNEGVY